MPDENAKVRAEIAALLSTVGTGSFASRRTAKADDLVLKVTGVGPLRLPIPREQARQLLAEATPARYGRREKTMLDRSVRDTGEIPARRVQLDRRRWKKTLEPMLAALGADLGLASGQRLAAELHSLLIYGPGQFFKQHQDSERADGMVGTLVVTLPSAFTGGAIVVEHLGQAVSYRQTKQPLSFIAFYADCRHEIRPVRTGYRIVLTYDLMLQGEASGAEPPQPLVVDALASLLRRHFQTPLPPSPYAPKGARSREPAIRLAYLLDHQYTARGLGWRSLKGSDASRAEILGAAAERAGCEVVLGLAEVHETRDCQEPWESAWDRRHHYEPDDEEDEWFSEDELATEDPSVYEVGELLDSSVTLESWMERGRDVPEPIRSTLREEEVCATTPSANLEPESSEYEGYMGNYGNTIDRWYRRAAIVLWPRERAFGVRAEAAPGWALAAVLESCRAGELAEGRKKAEALLASWKDLVSREEERRLLARALKVAVALGEGRLAAALLKPFSLQALALGMARDFAELVERYGVVWTKKVLAGWADSVSPGRFVEPRAVLAWLASLRTVAERMRAAEAGPEAPRATRLLCEAAWSVLDAEIGRRLRFSVGPGQHAALVLELAPAIFGWLSGAGVLVPERADRPGSMHGEASIARAVGLLCTDQRQSLVPCLVRMLRLAAAKVPVERRTALGLDAIACHCSGALAALLAVPPRAPEDWSVTLPAGCRCDLCRRLDTFLRSATERRLEWPLAKAGRQHVHGRLDWHELPVRHETRRSGSPFTLTLEKTKDLFSRETAMRRSWQSDLDWLTGEDWGGPVPAT